MLQFLMLKNMENIHFEQKSTKMSAFKMQPFFYQFILYYLNKIIPVIYCKDDHAVPVPFSLSLLIWFTKPPVPVEPVSVTVMLRLAGVGTVVFPVGIGG